MNALNLTSGLLPCHVAIAMDGNGRWAQQRDQPRTAGHRKGVGVAHDIILFSRSLGIEVLTLYAFSMENWGRDSHEVEVILDELLPLALSSNLEEFNGLGIRLEFLGEQELLSEQTQRVINQVRTATQANTGMILNLAVSYSGRLEILKAVRRVIAALQGGRITPADLDEDHFGQYLDSGRLPFPDLFIRCGGLNRISNFMLWQMAYTEIVTLDTLWPDFQPEHLVEAIRIYQRQPRKFGLVPDANH
jgi:undecaprenyl diphosphate synthase